MGKEDRRWEGKYVVQCRQYVCGLRPPCHQKITKTKHETDRNGPKRKGRSDEDLNHANDMDLIQNPFLNTNAKA